MTAHVIGEVTDSGLVRVDRFTWERWIRRFPLKPEVMLLALTMATYASAKGGDVRPGDERLANVLGCSDRTVRTNRNRLIEAGLLERVSTVRVRGRADEYALTIPSHILDVPGLLNPDERTDP